MSIEWSPLKSIGDRTLGFRWYKVVLVKEGLAENWDQEKNKEEWDLSISIVADTKVLKF